MITSVSRQFALTFRLYSALDLLEMFGSDESELILCRHQWKQYNTDINSVA